MGSLGDYLDLTVEEARGQWGRILQRAPRPRQEKFTPTEVVLCYALFFVLDPHKYGGSMSTAPAIVHELAGLFVRPPASINLKLLNLDGSRKNAGKHEWGFFASMAEEPDRFPHLYNVVLLAARQMGITPEVLPDFLHLEGADRLDLLGQEELTPAALDLAIEDRAERRRGLVEVTELDTVRIAEQEIRLGQHRFAEDVLENYGRSCGFCGFAPRSLDRNKLLVASHIKPWAKSDHRERLDHRNGVAACPTHDVAFDTGLITVNGGLRVHRSPALRESEERDPNVAPQFRDLLSPTLIVPEYAEKPKTAYLTWHHENVYQGTLNA